ncbi:unnamed protein product [Acanthoscelides obtectus]|uniref:Slowpoke-binding protein n=1 Tax=Acanthoscelides obtectus TaxID=200917 RepID=A0A9P0LBV8_ACAOB|nr:unnamed protein product [Acanthoscelides obtectus]CAK1664193.1 Slowpoke-binding protein [Acanthoscelides obtectus]
MFNLYQNIKQKEDGEKEPDVIGHERFYQARSSTRSVRKRRRAPRRTHSAGEFSPSTLSAANRRAQFKRSQSTENRDREDGKSSVFGTPQRVDSMIKVFFGYKRQTGLPKHEYSALKTDGGDKCKEEKQIRNGVYLVCKQHLENNDRYELKSQLEDIGSRNDKHWFTIQDKNLGAERLLTLLPLPSTCPLSCRSETHDTLLELFRGLQHPYIHPILDVEFWSGGGDTSGGGSSTPPAAAFIAPLNPAGSLKDMIYGVDWREPYDRKYSVKGQGLTLKTIQCLGRQILEGLLFLKNRYFPPIYHLHSGNVIIQNGVARIAGLENSLLGLLPRAPAAPAPLAFGYLLFEMAAGYELTQPPTAAHLQLELERAPKVAEALELVFRGERLPQLEELVRCDLFRGVELRELRGASIIQNVTPPDVMELLDIVKNPVPPSPLRRRYFTDDLEPWFA